MFHFKIEKKLKNNLGRPACAGRAGVLTTPHGVIKTPAFVAVGTKGTVKSLTPEQIKSTGAQVVLANTYHLYLQPGDELVKEAGGLHKFMNWDGPLMTDSGGFQVFSLGAAYGKDFSKIITTPTPPNLPLSGEVNWFPPDKGEARGLKARGEEEIGSLAKIGNDGVSFRSHIDGSLHYITPEKSIQIQHNLGADIIFAFDEATSPHENFAYQEEALARTHAWAKRSLEEHQRLITTPTSPQPSPESRGGSPFPFQGKAVDEVAIFGIVQGGLEKDLRRKSAEYISSLPFDGFGIGGSYTKEHMEVVVKLVNEILPETKPRHLLGIGEPEDLFMGVENGCDLFDCVAATRIARNGSLYTKEGKINILNAKYREDFSPVEKDCQCYTCNPSSNLGPYPKIAPLSGEEGSVPMTRGTTGGFYSKSYLAHLFRGKEMLAATLASIHNLYFIINLVKNIRQSILDNKFFEFKAEFLKNYRK